MAADENKVELPKLYSALDLKQAEQPRWLAKGRLPRAAISLLVGDEGIGKSLLWVWIVAAITRGHALSEFGIPGRDPARVIVVATEDDWSTTVRPRLEVAGADLSMISVICTEDDGSGAPTFPADMHLILDADPAPALVVVDAWLDTVPSGLSVKDPQQARRALHPWREAATRTDAAVLLLTHTNRVDSGNARDKYGATGELRKKARLTLFAQQDEDGNLTVGPEKANTTAPVAASVFTIDGIQHFDATDEHDGTVPLLRYVGDSDRTAREHIVDNHAGDDRESNRDVDDWLRAYLAPARQKATEVFTAADANGFSKDQVKRAKKRIGAQAVKDGVWWWQLATIVDGDVADVVDEPAPTKGAQERTKRAYVSETAPLLPSRSEAISECSLGSREQGSTDTGRGAPLPTPEPVPTDDRPRFSMLCSGCGTTMSLPSDRAAGHHGACPPKPTPNAAKARHEHLHPPRQPRRRTRGGQPVDNKEATA